MKLKGVLSYLCVVLLSFSIFSWTAEGTEEPALELLRVYGISEEVGVFRYINAPFFSNRNYYKQGMVLDSEGNLYVTDSGEGQIEVFDKELRPIRHFGSVGAGDGQFQCLTDIKIDQDEVFTLDIILGRIQVFTLEGKFLYQFDTGLSTEEYTSYPTGFAISLHEKIFVMDLFNGMKIFDRKGNLLKVFDSEEFLSGYEIIQFSPIDFFFTLEDMQSDEKGNVYCLINFGGDGSPVVLVLDPEGQIYSEEIPGISFSDYYTPNGLFALEEDYIYGILWSQYDQYVEGAGFITCSRIKLPFNAETEEEEYLIPEEIVNAEKLNQMGISIDRPTAFLVHKETMFILDSLSNAITRINVNGEIIDEYRSPLSSHGIWQGIYGDNQGTIFTTNVTKGCIEVRNQDLEVTATIGKPGIKDFLPDLGEFCNPYAMIQDTKGFLYCSDNTNGCIQVFDQHREPFFTFYPLEHLHSPAQLYLDSKGYLILNDRGKILVMDINQIDKKKINILKKIPWDGHSEIPSLAVRDNNTYLIPVHDDGILAEIGDNGQVKRRWFNTIKPKKEDVIYLPRVVWEDANHQYMLVDEWSGCFWKFNQNIRITWMERLNWFGIREAWESDDGTIYALDKAHNLILVLKDRTFESISSVSLDLDPIPDFTYEDKWTIHGFTDPGATLKISEETIPVNEEGEFTKELPLHLGVNKWFVRASHPSKKETSREFSIIRKQKIIIRMKVNSILISVNEEQKTLEAAPYLDTTANRVYAPIRIVVESVEGSVQWEAKEQKVTIHQGDSELILYVDEPYAYLNGKKILIDPVNEYDKLHPVVPTIVNGRVFLPLRFIGENLGFSVEWKGDTQEITLTYPDPKLSDALHQSFSVPGQSFGKVVSFSLCDVSCKIYQSEEEVSLVFIPSVYQYTGIFTIDRTGIITPSHIINTSGEVLQLSTGSYLILRQNGTGFGETSQNGFCFTWLDETGKLLQSKTITFDYPGFEVFQCKYLRETQEGGFEFLMTVGTPDPLDIFGYGVFFRMEFSSEGELGQVTMFPLEDAGTFRIGPTGFLSLTKYGDNTMSMHDHAGRTLWTKKIINPAKELENQYSNIDFSWLQDGSLFIYTTDSEGNLYQARLNQTGEVIWNSRILKQDGIKNIYLSDPALTNDGNLVSILTLYITSGKHTGIARSVLVLNDKGGIIGLYDVDLDFDSSISIQKGKEGDLWLGSSIRKYAFGVSSSLLYHIQPGEENNCFQSKFTLQNGPDSLIFETLENAANIEAEHKKIHYSSSELEITTQPIRILTKDLCP